MAVSTSQAPTGGGEPRRRLRDRFIWYVGSALGVTVAQQGLGLLRQIMIAAYFGLSRDYDGYVVAYSLALMLVFNTTGVFDSIVVSRLVQIHGRDGDAAFWRASDRILLQSALASLPFAGLFLAVLWLAIPIVAAGFSPPERALLEHLSWYFVPWVLVALPYYALSAHLKANWQFSWVFAAELLVIAVSIVVLWFDHGSIFSLPIAFSAGYASSSLLLLIGRGFKKGDCTVPAADFTASMGKQYLAFQVGTVTGFAERYFQSYLVPGGISALGYVGLIVNSLSSLLTFREIYIVPLTVEDGREERLERMLQGLALVSIPCALFLVVYAEPLVSVLLQRGKFTAEAAALTAAILRIQALSLVLSTVMVPLERLFQIVDRLAFTHIRYAAALIGTVIFQTLFVFHLHWDVQGVAWAWLCNSTLVLAVVLVLVRRCGILIRWRGVFANALLAASAAAVALGLSWAVASKYSGLLELIWAASIYAAVLGICVLITRRRWQAIVG